MSVSPPDLRRMRNQLDEMDALLERMLKLPLTEPPPAVVRSGSLLDELDALAERPAIAGRISPAPEPPVAGPRLLVHMTEEEPTEPTTIPLAPPAEPASAPTENQTPELATPPLSQETDAAKATIDLPPLRVTVVADPAAAGTPTVESGGLVAGINQVWDAGWAWLGWPGRVARHPVTRQFLGFLGVLMLSGAAALALGRWLGWAWLEPLGK